MLDEYSTDPASPRAIGDDEPADFDATCPWREEEGSQQGGARRGVAFAHAESGSSGQIPGDCLVECRLAEHGSEQRFGFRGQGKKLGTVEGDGDLDSQQMPSSDVSQRW